MPYILKEDRPELDELIEELASSIKRHAKGDGRAVVGPLNYCCTTLALKVLPEKRYWAMAMLSGVFHNIADEFYRRFMSPYEDVQIKKNGDVYPEEVQSWRSIGKL